MPAVLLLVLLLVVSAPAVSQELAPGTAYDPAIPTSSTVLGYEFGEEITPPEGIVTYLEALAAAAPDRTRLIEYARTWQRRPLHVLAVGAPARIARLEEVKAGLRRLADPRALAAPDAERLVAELPVVTWLIHGVHGNEISSSDAALALAYHLLAARDPDVEAILRDSIVLVDPSQNPDGRARFVFHNVQSRAADPDADPVAAERDEPWPGGRSNHYLFDMNRDWFAQSQPETRGRGRLYLEWFPHVVVDLHEMSGDSTYYFAPPADPLNPHITAEQARWFETFGRANAARFDERGFPYFIREIFDSFYPGYGESWPIFHGAIGMTYEQASARGLVFRRRDETRLTYRDGVVRHFTAALTTAATAARHRERILRDFLQYRRTAVEEGQRGVREYLIPPGHDPARAERLARLLAAQGIEVRRAAEPVRAGNRTLPAGTFVVPLAQPAGRLARNLLDPEIEMDRAFVEEQDRRRRARLGEQIYDVTAWNLPMMFDVEVVAADRPTGGSGSLVPGSQVPGAAGPLPAAKVGYLLPWGTGTAAALVEALQQGIRVQTAGASFSLGGREYPIGTAIVRVSENGDDLRAALGAIVARHDAEAVPVDTAWVDEGVSLGSNRVVTLRAPRVLLAWDSPTRSLSAGWTRYVLERRYGQPVTAVRAGSLGRVDMSRYDVLVLPAGTYTLGEEALRRLKDWIRAGGTLVTLGEASRWAAGRKAGLLDTHTELRDGRPDEEPDEEDEPRPPARKPDEPFDLDEALRPVRERPEALAGALLRVALDRRHWLTAGHREELTAVVEGDRVFAPLRLDKGRNVGLYAPADRLVASGLVWPEARQRLAQKAFLIHQPLGRGHIIAFAEDPNFRAFAEATQLLFINAVLLGPAY